MKKLNLKKIKIEIKLDELAESLLNNDTFPHQIGFLGGQSGITFFFLMYSRFKHSEQYQEKAFDMLEQAILSLNSGKQQSTTFSDGMAGYGWMIEYLNQKKVITVDTDELLEELDQYLSDDLFKYLQVGDYDFLHGAGGIMLYFLKRISGGSGHAENLRGYIEKAVDLLIEQSIINHGSIKWKSILNVSTKRIGYNISLAHGMSSIVMLLCKVIEEGIYENQCRHLLAGVSEYILQQKQDPILYQSFFPSYSLESEGKPEPSRLGWCYGDLGISNSLKIAGTLLNKPSMVTFAEEVKRHLLKTA